MKSVLSLLSGVAAYLGQRLEQKLRHLQCPLRRLMGFLMGNSESLACPNGMLMASHSNDLSAGSSSPKDSLSSAVVRSPRQEEKWQAREQHLLDLTQTLIDEHGFAQFNMDRLVKVSDVSKGTIYNHFSGKEDCLAGLCIRCMEETADMFRRALAFDGKPREVALAVHYAYRLHLRLNPTFSMSLVTVRTASFAEKTSPERAQRLSEMDAELFSLAYQVMDQAIASGDMPARDDIDQTVLAFLNWALSYGINMLADTGFEHSIRDHLGEQNIALIGANILMDGLGMTPLASEWDYQKTWERIGNEVFPDEVNQLSLSQPSAGV